MRFMQGRYGADKFSQFITIVALVLLVINIFLRVPVIGFICLALLVYTYFRMFSKNISARYKENQKYMQITGGIRQKFKNVGQLGKYHIYKCPSCSQKIRIPRGKGKIEVTCPKCRTKFVKKS